MAENKSDNNERSFRIAELIARFMKGELDIEESRELEAWLEEDPANRDLFAGMNDPGLQKKDFDYFMGKDVSGSWEKVAVRVEQKNTARLNTYKWWAVAASLLLAVSLLSWWFAERNKKNRALVASSREIYPGSYNAVLIDDRGISHHLQKDDKSQIRGYVSNTVNGLHYLPSGTVAGTNTLIVPVKGMFHVRLEDGTEVWLHPSTTMTYPVAFSGTERRVSLSGDAYFKVAKNSQMPFRVYCNGVVTQAVGTEFNISSTDSGCSTALVQGRVLVTNKAGTVSMDAGTRLNISKGTIPTQREKLDTSMAGTWKNGNFLFHHTPFAEAMSALAAWYGISTSYDKDFDWRNKAFNGVILRHSTLGETLQTIELTGIASFSVEGNTVYIHSR